MGCPSFSTFARRHHAEARCSGVFARDHQQLRRAKVEKLGHPITGDKDIARLQVAMNNQVAMRVFNRGADLKEKADPVRYAELGGVAVAIDRAPIYVLHDEIWIAVGPTAALEQPGDVRMIELRQDLA